MKSKIGAYIRVSTIGQNEEGQRAEIEKWLIGNLIDPAQVCWFVDKGKSGDTLKRPAFEKLQKAIFMGEIQTVVCWKLDRLSRSLRDGIATLCDWLDRGVRLVSVTQLLDFNAVTGKLIASVLFACSELEQQTRKERQAVGIMNAKKKGVYAGRKPGTTKAKPEKALALRKKGLTVAEIAKVLEVSICTAFIYLRKQKA